MCGTLGENQVDYHGGGPALEQDCTLQVSPGSACVWVPFPNPWTDAPSFTNVGVIVEAPTIGSYSTLAGIGLSTRWSQLAVFAGNQGEWTVSPTYPDPEPVVPAGQPWLRWMLIGSDPSTPAVALDSSADGMTWTRVITQATTGPAVAFTAATYCPGGNPPVPCVGPAVVLQGAMFTCPASR